MTKRFMILLLSSFIGIAGTPEILTAHDSVMPMGIDSSGIVETVVLPEKTEPASEVMPVKEPAPAPVAPVAPTPAPRPTPAPAPVYVAPANNIQIAGRTLAITDVASTTADSGDHVNKYGEKFLYGHNSSAVFRGLYNMGIGSTFMVTYGGVTKSYRVEQVVVFEKNNGLLQLNGSGSYMLSVSKAKYSGVPYDLSLMTCYGTSYGNGDASHRLVLFANAI